MAISTYRGLLARSDVDKGEVSPDTDLRARSSEAKVVIEGTHATMAQTVGTVTQVATGWAEITGTIAQSEVGTTTQSATGLVQIDLTGTITQTTPAITQSVGSVVINQLRKCKLTIQSGEVSGSSNLTDFPILLRKECLPSEMFDSDGSSPAQADGADIMISADEAGTTMLPVEVVAFSTDADPANGYAEIWTKLTVDYNDDTDLWIWYNTTITSTATPADASVGSEAVWSDYAYVGHNLITDSAGNYTPVDTNTAAITNPFGNATGARDFTSGSDIITVPIDIHTEGTYVFSLQCWAQARTSSFNVMSAGDSGSVGTVHVGPYSASVAGVAWANSGGNTLSGHVDDRALNQWLMWTGQFADHNSLNDLIINGGSSQMTWNHNTDTRPFNRISFGRSADISPSGAQPGDVCEGRLRFGAGVTEDWVYTEFANQDDPAAFIVVATPTDFDYETPAGPTATITQITPAITQSITGAESMLGPITQTLPAITQAVTGAHAEGTNALISIHHLNAGFQTLDGMSTHRFAASAEEGFTVAAVYNNESDYLKDPYPDGAVGMADGKLLTFSMWVKRELDYNNRILFTMDHTIHYTRINGSGDTLTMQWADSSGAKIVDHTTSETIESTDGWVHILFSVDAGNTTAAMYLNDTAIADSITVADYSIDWTSSEYFVGARDAYGNFKYSGDMAEFYLTNEYLDLSAVANRRKFIDGDGKPVDLGSDGSEPTGTAALFYFKADADTPANWRVNHGSSSDFSVVGTFENSSSSPSD